MAMARSQQNPVWLGVCGYDDQLDENYLKFVLQLIEDHPSIDLIIFSGGKTGHEEVEVSEAEEMFFLLHWQLRIPVLEKDGEYELRFRDRKIAIKLDSEALTTRANLEAFSRLAPRGQPGLIICAATHRHKIKLMASQILKTEPQIEVFKFQASCRKKIAQAILAPLHRIALHWPWLARKEDERKKRLISQKRNHPR